jgi:hypothetical protein
MKKSVQKAFFSGLFLLFLTSRQAEADLSPYLSYAPGRTDVGVLGKYYYTNANYNNGGGSYTTMPFSDNLVNYTGTPQIRTVMTDSKLAFFGELQFSSTTAKGYALTNQNSNFSYAKVGTDFVLFDYYITVIPEFSLLYPMSTNDFTNTTTAAIGEGVTEGWALLKAQGKFGWFGVGGYSGYIYRSNGRSALLPYAAFAEFTASNVKVGAKVWGFSSLSNDQDTNNTVYRNAWSAGADGGSLLFGSVNPQVLVVDGYLDLTLNKKLVLSLGGGTSINGANYAAGYDVQAAVTYRFGGSGNSKNLLNRRSGDPIPDFQEQTKDGVDQGLFDGQSPSNPVPRDDRDVKSSLDRTEMQMELKKKKKPIQDNE